MDIFYLIMDWDSYDVTLVVTNPYGSDSLTKVDYIEVRPESVAEMGLNERNVNLYPNPNKGNFVVSVPASAEVALNIMDIHGKTVMMDQFTGSRNIQLDTLEKGIYLVKIRDVDSGSVVVKRLLIN